MDRPYNTLGGEEEHTGGDAPAPAGSSAAYISARLGPDLVPAVCAVSGPSARPAANAEKTTRSSPKRNHTAPSTESVRLRPVADAPSPHVRLQRLGSALPSSAFVNNQLSRMERSASRMRAPSPRRPVAGAGLPLHAEAQPLPPVQTPVPSPIQAPVPPPIQAPMPLPIQAPMPPPIQAPVPPPIQAPMPPPVQTPLPPVIHTPIPPQPHPRPTASTNDLLFLGARATAPRNTKPALNYRGARQVAQTRPSTSAALAPPQQPLPIAESPPGKHVKPAAPPATDATHDVFAVSDAYPPDAFRLLAVQHCDQALRHRALRMRIVGNTLEIQLRGLTSVRIPSEVVVHAYAWFSVNESYVDLRLQAIPSDLIALLSAHGPPCTNANLTLVRLELGEPAERLPSVQAALVSALGQRVKPLLASAPYSPHYIYAGTARTPVRTYSLRSRAAQRPRIVDSESPVVLDESPACVPDLEENPALVCRYPPGGTDSVAITTNEVRRLQPGMYLNDSLLDLGLRLALAESSVPSVRVHVFSTFFYTRLASGTVQQCSVDIFARDLLLVPVNEHSHWYLIAVWNPSAVLRPGAGDDDPKSSPRGKRAPLDAETTCAVIILDSLGSRHRPAAIERVRRFVASEASGRTETPQPVSALYARVPQQPNLADCGCFVIENARRLVAADGPAAIAAMLARQDLSSWYDAADVGRTVRSSLLAAIHRIAGDAPRMSFELADAGSSDVEEVTFTDHCAMLEAAQQPRPL